ncbi:MAG: class I SAM-dependent methyltransferase [Pseudomonadales bacterium]|jgi:SAM-dependent methyltransferase|nr:class I SAM-dependent methyltransferase [Pseudomonadales bacterium]
MPRNPYDDGADRFFTEYEGIPFEQAHARFLEFIPRAPVPAVAGGASGRGSDGDDPPAPGAAAPGRRAGATGAEGSLVLDVGAGSGRDAAWFAARGHEVFAVEPATRLREVAAAHHTHPRIHWIDDRLPGLERITRAGTTFDVVWLSAVWMHIAPSDRPRAFRKLANRLRPGGRLFLSLRHGAFDDDRPAYSVDAAEVLKLAREHGLVCIQHAGAIPDGRGRQGVSWENLVLELPDDGSGAFPRLRNIILNDDRAATYKLGLLRALLRIADGSPGLVELDDHGDARVPLGLVALYWIRLYRPLLAADFRQAPGTTGYGFADADFEALRIANSLLKPGARFRGNTATHLQRALRSAAKHIRTMPANFITDANGRPVFRTHYQGQPNTSDLRLDAPTLRAFGELVVPAPLWRAMRQHAVWIEPVIESEWIATMRGYDASLGRRPGTDAYLRALAWIEPDRDTREVRAIVDGLRGTGELIHCTWRGTRLRADYAVDHVVPWVRWPCNDLWNLVPASVTANSAKGDRLPSADLLTRSEDRFCEWWTRVRRADDETSERFEQEVQATLPFVAQPSNAQELFDGLALLRASLRRDQQIPEWAG